MARSDPGGRSRLARWSRWVGGRVLVAVALVASVGVAGAQPAAAVVKWQQVAAGERHTCGIRENGTLWCWGDNFRGQLGLGDTTDRSLPTQVGTDSDWIMVTAGSGHTCAVKTFRKIRYCWGDNYAGRLGLGTNGATDLEHRMYLSPTSAGDSGWESLSAGSDATCGIRTQHLVAPGGQLVVQKGRLLCWGDNYAGSLGVTSQARYVVSPTPVAGGGQWTEVSVGGIFICGLRGDGQVPGERYCWGLNDYAQLGLGQQGSWVTVPTPVPGDGSWSTVTTGARHGCGISVNRRAYCWGSRSSGAVGLGEPGPGDGCCVLAPETRLPGTSWAQIDASGWNTCGLTTNGTRLCWGDNYKGQLGLGDRATRYSPVETNEGAVWASLSLGGFHGCGIRKTGALFCWGANPFGGLGSSQVPVGGESYVPVPVG